MAGPRALADLLMSCFSASELRRLIRYEYSALVNELPGENASAAALAEAVAEKLEAHSLVGAAFWALLLRERPGRGADIRTVQAAWEGGAPRAERAAWRWLGPGPENPLARALAQALVRLEIPEKEEPGRGPGALATGWLLAPDLILAPASALLRRRAGSWDRDGRGVEATLVAHAASARGWRWTAPGGDEEVALEGAEVVTWDHQADFVLLRMVGPAGAAPPVLALPPPALPPIGAPLLVLGQRPDGAVAASTASGRLVGTRPQRLTWAADHAWLAGALVFDPSWRPFALVLGSPRGADFQGERREALPLAQVLASLARRSPGTWRALDQARGGALTKAGAAAPDEGAVEREAFRARLKLQLADLGPPETPERASLDEGFDARRRALTVELGVSEGRASMTELVGAAVRRGRLAELLTTALDHAEDPSAVGGDLLAFFHEPPDGDRP